MDLIITGLSGFFLGYYVRYLHEVSKEIDREIELDPWTCEGCEMCYKEECLESPKKDSYIETLLINVLKAKKEESLKAIEEILEKFIEK